MRRWEHFVGVLIGCALAVLVNYKVDFGRIETKEWWMYAAGVAAFTIFSAYRLGVFSPPKPDAQQDINEPGNPVLKFVGLIFVILLFTAPFFVLWAGWRSQ